MTDAATCPDIVPVILSAGSGTALWPFSRPDHPKPFQPLAGAHSLFQDTVARVGDPARFAAPIIICEPAHEPLVAEQLDRLGVTPEAVVPVPADRGSAPATTVAAIIAQIRRPDAMLLVLPADHVVADAAGLLAAVDGALALARAQALVAFGTVPGAGAGAAGAVVTGPAIRDDGHLEETGMYLFGAETWLAELARLQPDILLACRDAMVGARRDRPVVVPDATPYAAAPALSIHGAIIRRSNRTVAAPVHVGWSDAADWSVLWDIGEKDERGNILDGDVVIEDVHDCYVRGGKRLIAGIGLSGMVVVDTDDALLITRRDRSGDVGLVVDLLRAFERPEVRRHAVTIHAWGRSRTLHAAGSAEITWLTIKPGAHAPRERGEDQVWHGIVVAGTARACWAGHSQILGDGESLSAFGAAGWDIENAGPGPLDLIEIRIGTPYGRADLPAPAALPGPPKTSDQL